jgi:hypothetical protein
MFVPSGQEFLDRGNQIVNAQERTTADAFVGQFREPAFDQVQPTATGRDVVHREARMLRQPSLDLGRAVSAVIVHHQVQRSLSRKVAIDTPAGT